MARPVFVARDASQQDYNFQRVLSSGFEILSRGGGFTAPTHDVRCCFLLQVAAENELAESPPRERGGYFGRQPRLLSA
eukprot:scaffold102833_cov19-Tisochrysis_lutea.AAC.1